MSKLRTIALQDGLTAIIDYRGKTPPKSLQGITLISAANIKSGKLDFSRQEFISKDDYKNWTVRGFAKPRDILFTTEAPTGEVALYPDEGIYQISRRVIALRTDEKSLHHYYLFYALQSPYIKRKLLQANRGSTVPRLLKTDITEFELSVPPLEEQKAIAAVLSCLDGKIENLRKQNETLEAIAQTLFKHWFIDFEFPNDEGKPYKSSGGEMISSELGEIPEGWRVGTLGEITRVINGRAYKQTEFREEGTPIVRIQNLTGKGQTVYSDLELNEDKHINKGDLIYAWSATFGAYIWRGLKSIYHYHIWKLNCFNPTFKYYAYLHLKRVSDRVKGQGTGSIFTHITKALMETQDLYIPDDLLMSQWNSLSSSMFDKIMSNHEQIQTLIKTRDTLLPKLMSGKLRVK